MMRDVLLLVVLIFVQLQIFSQVSEPSKPNTSTLPIEKQYDSFRKTFEKETTNIPKTTPKKENNKPSAANLPPAELPTWIVDFSTPQNENMYFTLGISDPGLDSAVAVKQAIIRAKGLLSLFSGAIIQNITDNYANEYRDGDILEKFTSFSKIESSHRVSINEFQVIQKGFTAFGEAIVLAGIPKASPNGNNQVVNTKAEYFLSEEGKSNDLKLFSTYSIFVADGEGNTAGFTAHKTKKSILVNSAINQDSLEFDYGKFKYLTPISTEPPADELIEFSYTDLTNGLWNAWFLAVLRQIESSEKQTSGIKKMGDLFSSKFQNLTREVSEIKLGFKPYQLFVKENTLYLKLIEIRDI